MEVAAQFDTTPFDNTDRGPLKGLATFPFLLGLSNMWLLDYGNEMYKYLILSYFYLLLINWK